MDNQNQIQRIIARIPPAWRDSNRNDYIGEDGLLYCGECHTAKQVKIPAMLGSPARVVNCLCKCLSDRRDREEEARRLREEVERLQREGLTDRRYFQYTFAKDDRKNAAFSDSCRRYVQQWEELEKDGLGIVFYGNPGTGKTFYACCIANALMEKKVSVLVTSLPVIIRQLDRMGEEVIEKIQRPRLLVLDDLGAERDTSTANELAYQIIDARYRTGKPMIVTTNLSKEALYHPVDTNNVKAIDKMRIYDRILERCRSFRVDGESRRKAAAR